MRESDLYAPVKRLLEDMGYSVKAEVEDIDVTAVRDNELLIVELKKSFSLTLILQAIKRQRITDKVYIAIPRPSGKGRFSKDFKDKEYLIRRLELGLMVVAMEHATPYAQIIIEPKSFDRNLSMARSVGKKKKALYEINERHGDFNVGGTTGQKLVTVYREKSLAIAAILEKKGELSVKEIREAVPEQKASSILNKNYYGWFERVQRGHYCLSSKGRIEIEQYRNVLSCILCSIN